MRFFQVIIIIFIPILIISANIIFLTFDKNFYFQIYSNQFIYQTLGKEITQSATDNLHGYFRGQNSLEDKFFSNQAKIHLADVKLLLETTLKINIFSIFTVILSSLILIRKKMFKTLKTSFIFGSLASIFIIIVIGLLAYFNFDFLFIKFHQVLFTNNLWIFSQNDNLIKLFPEKFFIAFANQLFANIIISSVLITIFAKLLIRNDKST